VQVVSGMADDVLWMLSVRWFFLSLRREEEEVCRLVGREETDSKPWIKLRPPVKAETLWRRLVAPDLVGGANSSSSFRSLLKLRPPVSQLSVPTEPTKPYSDPLLSMRLPLLANPKPELMGAASEGMELLEVILPDPIAPRLLSRARFDDR